MRGPARSGVWICFFALSQLAWLERVAALQVNLTVPDFQITKDDMYVCTTAALPDQPMKLVGIIPRARMDVVHHILLFGCKTPFKTPEAGKPQPAWECQSTPMCADGGYNIMYGWGRNAPDLQLPDGVGFSVGQHTGINYIVAQVHYLTKERPHDDHSGVTLLLKPKPLPYSAGIIAFAASFTIPPRTPSYLVPNECCYQGHQPLTTFAMRVHTHVLGRSVYMNRENYNHSGLQQVSHGNPQLPQAFYAVQRTTIWPGDKLTVTCDFNSSGRDTPTNSGSTHNDEMCNMYMMVYGWHPFLAMNCGGPTYDMPGAIPSRSKFVADPSPFWSPPAPKKSPLGIVTSVALGADGALWGLYRGNRTWDVNTFDNANHVTARTPIQMPVVVRMAADSGKVLAAFGKDTFYMPHMMTLDHEGNVWVVDVGLHQVLKLSPTGQLLMTLGTKLQPGSSNTTFCKPTRVALMRDGTIFVADGYCNSRIMKFSKDGKFLMSADVEGVVIHHLLLDECMDRVYVVSRERPSRVTAFNLNTLKEERKFEDLGDGRIWSLVTKPYGGVLALVWDNDKSAKLVDIEQPAKSWELPGMEKQFPHDIAWGPAPLALSGAGDRLHAVYVATTCPTKECAPLQRFVLVPEGRQLPSVAALKAFGPQQLYTVPGGNSPPGPLPDAEEEDKSAAMDGQDTGGKDGVDDEGGDDVEKEKEDEAVAEEEKEAEKAAKEEEKDNEKVYEEEEEEEEKETEEEEEKEYEKEVEEEEEDIEKEVKKEEEEEEAEAKKDKQQGATPSGSGSDKKDNDDESEEEDYKEYEKEVEEEYKQEEEEEEKEKAQGDQEQQQQHTKKKKHHGPYDDDFYEEMEVGDQGHQASIGQIIALVLVAILLASLVVLLALRVMGKFVTPSAQPGSAGATAGFKPLNGTQAQSRKPVLESIEEMLEGSGSLSFEVDDVEASGHVAGPSAHRHSKSKR